MGVNRTLAERSCRSIYSLKVKVISLLRKLVEESLGLAISSWGGKESFGPPDGGIILAQLVAPVIQYNSTRPNTKLAGMENFFMRRCKLSRLPAWWKEFSRKLEYKRLQIL